MLQSSGSADCAEKFGIIRSVNISKEKGTQKFPVDVIELKPEHGIIGDAHAGNWHRQVSLLGVDSVQKVQEKVSVKLPAGSFAENILVEGLCLYELPIGTKIMVGSALCEVTQIGKECHNSCAIRELTGDCVMPREGIFARVLEPGTAKAGDSVTVLN